MSRDTLHDLVDRIPEEELSAAKRYLEYLVVSPAYRAALSASPDDEPVTEADAAAIARARDEVRDGKVISHGEILREFGCDEIYLAGLRTIRFAGNRPGNGHSNPPRAD